jgi:hypothetical protein
MFVYFVNQSSVLNSIYSKLIVYYAIEWGTLICSQGLGSGVILDKPKKLGSDKWSSLFCLRINEEDKSYLAMIPGLGTSSRFAPAWEVFCQNCIKLMSPLFVL